MFFFFKTILRAKKKKKKQIITLIYVDPPCLALTSVPSNFFSTLVSYLKTVSSQIHPVAISYDTTETRHFPMVLLSMTFKPIMCIDAFGIHGRFISSFKILAGRNNLFDLITYSHIDVWGYTICKDQCPFSKVVASMKS